ncbi:hypothetical protein NECAME_08061 [Necator americanus]|uniref:Uncharacterized protein n=1 Tax=Necator americanus TaxID=51031 RepID=W2TKC6_NECAM|nr:hypothetical protein NECAME_08061 [Necator americanus]ETN82238.1 hypothetical protein NECAME_08061 [Necator americanus]
MAVNDLQALSDSLRCSSYTRPTQTQQFRIRKTRPRPWDFHHQGYALKTLIPLSSDSPLVSVAVDTIEIMVDAGVRSPQLSRDLPI